MKAKDLRYPFSFEERRPAVSCGVLFIPAHFDHKQVDLEPFFDLIPKERSIHIEYCSGNGQWIIDQAEKEPEIFWIALEKRMDRVQKIWAKREAKGLNNLFIVCGEAQPYTEYYVPKDCFDRVFVHFPDPWPKDRHAKHRLLQEPFVSHLSDAMRQEACLRIVTDDAVYAQYAIDHLLKNPRFSPNYEEPYYHLDQRAVGSSFFHDLWLSKGSQIYVIDFSSHEALCKT